MELQFVYIVLIVVIQSQCCSHRESSCKVVLVKVDVAVVMKMVDNLFTTVVIKQSAGVVTISNL